MRSKIFDAIIFATAAMLSFNSCKKTDTAATADSTVSTIKNDAALSIFAAIESRSGDDDIVNNSAAIVVPVDSAFINAGITAAIAANISPAGCDSIVKYYAIAGGINFNGTSNAETAFSSGLGNALYADSTGTQLYFDGTAAISSTPEVVGKSAIYKLSKFINLPAASVAQITTADTSLSLFNEAFNRTNLAANLTSGSFTLLMPVNSAFINAGYPDIASIDAADITVLTQILLYHTIANNFFTNDLMQQSSLTTLQGGAIQLSTGSGSLQITGNSSAALPANLVNNGELAGNNVETYKINNLLLP